MNSIIDIYNNLLIYNDNKINYIIDKNTIYVIYNLGYYKDVKPT